MKYALPGFFLVTAFFAACTITQSSEATSRPGVSPVGHVEQQVRIRVAGLQSLQGAQLLTSMETLIKCGALARKPVIEGLSSPDPRMRASLVYVLGYIGGSEARVAVSERLGDTDVGVRYEAAAALLQMGDVSGLPVLIKLLDDRDARVRFKAIEAVAGVAGQHFGYEFNASPAERGSALQRIKAWWAERSTTVSTVTASNRQLP
ncbi:MAG: HEAT repeat domain-containing protein [Planctomycetes bacterium]|nr:HEAT repeat domain-containing protein [Planctomycetota bacterium]